MQGSSASVKVGSRRQAGKKTLTVTVRNEDLDDGNCAATRSEKLNRTFASDLSKMASPMPCDGAFFGMAETDAEKERKYRADAIRLLHGDPSDSGLSTDDRSSSVALGSPREQADEHTNLSFEGADGSQARVKFEDAAQVKFEDAGGSQAEEKSKGGGFDRKRVSGGYRQPTTKNTLSAAIDLETPMNLKRMSAESKIAAYENRVQDLQTLLRQNQTQVKQIQAEVAVKLEKQRRETDELISNKNAEIEGIRAQLETVQGSYNLLQAVQSKKTDKAERQDIVSMDRDHLTALTEKLKSTSNVIAALSSKVEEQRKHMVLQTIEMEKVEEQCTASQEEAKIVKDKLQKLQAEYDSIQQNTDHQSTLERKHVKLAKDQIARIVAKHAVDTKSWHQKEGEMQSDLSANAKTIKELQRTVKEKEREVSELQAEVMKNLWRPEIGHTGVQTDKVPNRWLWLLTLKIASISDMSELKHSRYVQTDPVRIEGYVSGKSRTETKSTMTNAEAKKIENETAEDGVFWKGIKSRVEQLTSFLVSNSGSNAEVSMSDCQALSLVSTIYAEKYVADYLDNKKGRNLQPMRDFVWCYVLRETGDKRKAEKLLVKFLANIMWRANPKPSGSESRTAEMVQFYKFRDRYGFFARTLGYSFVVDREEYPQITTEGLNVWLHTLVRARQGAWPLLESNVKQHLVPVSHIYNAVDYVFAASKTFERESIKTFVADKLAVGAATSVGSQDYQDTINQWGVEDEVDLERALEQVLLEYQHIDNRWDVRLQALFAANDQDGDGNLDIQEYQDMMHKLDNDEEDLDTVVQHMRLYASMCMFPRIDANVFCKVAKLHRLAVFKPGAGYHPSKEQSIANTHWAQRLIPLHKAATESMMESYDAVHEHIQGPELYYKWSMCEKLAYERVDPEIAWILFHQATRLFSSIQNGIKDKRNKLVSDQKFDSGKTCEEEDNAGLAGEDKKRRFFTNKKFTESQVPAPEASTKQLLKKNVAFSTMNPNQMATFVHERHDTESLAENPRNLEQDSAGSLSRSHTASMSSLDPIVRTLSAGDSAETEHEGQESKNMVSERSVSPPPRNGLMTRPGTSQKGLLSVSQKRLSSRPTSPVRSLSPVRPPSSRIKRTAAAEISSESIWEVKSGSGQDGVNKGTDGIGPVTSQERTEIMLPSVQSRSKPSSPTGGSARRSGAARSPSPAHTSKSPTDRREGKEARKGKFESSYDLGD